MVLRCTLHDTLRAPPLAARLHATLLQFAAGRNLAFYRRVNTQCLTPSPPLPYAVAAHFNSMSLMIFSEYGR